MKKPFIGVAGNIGVGKTTFSEIISKKLKGQFDIVVSRHVIEHISNLKEFVNQMCLLLKPNGTLIVETPSQNTIIQKKLTRVFILQHIHYFSEFGILYLKVDASVLSLSE